MRDIEAIVAVRVTAWIVLATPRSRLETAGSDQEHVAIVAAALDDDGWLDGAPARMDRALHHDLVKRSLSSSGDGVSTITASQMVGWTADGEGRRQDPGDRRIVMCVHHVPGSIATATVTMAVYVDDRQLAEWTASGGSSTCSGRPADRR